MGFSLDQGNWGVSWLSLQVLPWWIPEFSSTAGGFESMSVAVITQSSFKEKISLLARVTCFMGANLVSWALRGVF